MEHKESKFLKGKEPIKINRESKYYQMDEFKGKFVLMIKYELDPATDRKKAFIAPQVYTIKKCLRLEPIRWRRTSYQFYVKNIATGESRMITDTYHPLIVIDPDTIEEIKREFFTDGEFEMWSFLELNGLRIPENIKQQIALLNHK